MTTKYKFYADETGQVRNLVFTPPNYVLEDGWKVGDCVDDVLPDINTLHEQKYLDAQALIQYKDDRKAEYPPWADQLDYIFHNGFDKWKADIVQPIKDKYPKPE